MFLHKFVWSTWIKVNVILLKMFITLQISTVVLL